MSHHRNKTFKKLTEEDLNDPKFVYIKGYVDNIFRNKQYPASIEAFGFYWLCSFSSPTCWSTSIESIRQFRIEKTGGVYPENKYHTDSVRKLYSYISTQKAVRYTTQFLNVADRITRSYTESVFCTVDFLELLTTLRKQYPANQAVFNSYIEVTEGLENLKQEAATHPDAKIYILPEWEFTYNVRQPKDRKRVLTLRKIMKTLPRNVYVVPHLVRSRGNHVKLLINP